MKITPTAIKEVVVLEPPVFGDERGHFMEVYNKKTLEKFPETQGIIFVQDNYSLSVKKGTLRGLHFQSGEFAQDKLVRVSAGEVLDVAVDIRHGSPTFGKYVAEILSAENKRQLFIPKGFAHGFITLTDNTEVQYKVSNYYSKEHDHGLIWNDKDVNIDWGKEAAPVLSEKDGVHPSLKDLPVYFKYGSGN